MSERLERHALAYRLTGLPVFACDERTSVVREPLWTEADLNYDDSVALGRHVFALIDAALANGRLLQEGRRVVAETRRRTGHAPEIGYVFGGFAAPPDDLPADDHIAWDVGHARVYYWALAEMGVACPHPLSMRDHRASEENWGHWFSSSAPGAGPRGWYECVACGALVVAALKEQP